MARNEQARDADQKRSLLDRRGYLKLAGAAAATAASTSALGSDGAAAQTDPVFHRENFRDSSYSDVFTSSWRQGEQDSVTTEDSQSGGSSLRVDIPQGSHYGCDTSIDPKKAGLLDQNTREMYASYWVKFGSDFDMGGHSFACKLPGFENEERDTAGIEPSDGTNGWRARGMFTSGSGGVQIGYYTYHMDQSGKYGDSFEATTVSRGEWHHVEQYIKLNTVSGGDANRDGELKLWVDGDRKINRTDMRYTLYPDNGVNYAFQVYYGGGDPSPADNHLYIDNWTLATSKLTASQQQQQEGDLLELVTNQGTENLSYDFTVDGNVSKNLTSGDVTAESNDSISANDDGTVTVSGVSGNGMGDSYFVDGTITSMTLDESKWTIRYKGSEVSKSDIVESGDGSTDTSSGGNGPSVNKFALSKSQQLGDDRMFSVNWDVSAANKDLDTVEVVVARGTDVNFSVTDVGGQSASNWDLFQFPVGASLRVSLRVTDKAGNVTKQTKELTL